jgi:hypothetical protein
MSPTNSFRVQPGDVLVRPKSGLPVVHVGVVVSENRVLHNLPEKGEHESDINEFANGLPVKVRRPSWIAPGFFQRVSRTRRNPRAYHLTSRNCEHTATEVLFGRAESEQLGLVVGTLAVVVVLYLCGRKS